MTPVEEGLVLLARESGRLLGELGLRPLDEKWIGQHAETLASLASPGSRPRPRRGLLYRLARRAARTAR